VQSDGELLVLNAFGKTLSRRLSETPALIAALDTPAAELLAPEATEAAAQALRAAVAEAAKTAEDAAKAAAGAREAAEKADAAAKASPDSQAAQNAATQARGAAEAAARLAEEKAAAAGDIASKFPPVFTGTELTLLAVYKTGRAESIRWTNSGQSFALAFPALAAPPLAVTSRGDKLGMALANGKVSLYSVAEKRALWSGDSHIASSDTPEDSSLIYDERGLYALTKSGATGYFEDGKQHWLQRIQDAKAPPAFSDEGILYSGGNDWVLYAYHLEDTIKTQRQSIYGPASEGSYGTGNPRPSPWAEDFNRYEEAEIRDRLGRISTAAREGRLGENERSYAAYLMEIAGSIADAPMNQSRTHPLIQVNYRVEAARLLASMGSRETIPFLASLCRSDPDPLVKAAAAEAIGYIGVDPDGIALAAFRSMIFPLIPNRNEQVLASVAAATGSLCRFSGPPLSEAGIRLLSALADIGPAFAQAVARRELQSLR
jgi:outer membrane protein assembly factor BamB